MKREERKMRYDNTKSKVCTERDVYKRQWQYDVVFLDVEMDEVNGIMAAESIHNINKECLLFFVTNNEVYMDYACLLYTSRCV